jgi:hypothetical protein
VLNEVRVIILPRGGVCLSEKEGEFFPPMDATSSSNRSSVEGTFSVNKFTIVNIRKIRLLRGHTFIRQRMKDILIDARKIREVRI